MHIIYPVAVIVIAALFLLGTYWLINKTCPDVTAQWKALFKIAELDAKADVAKEIGKVDLKNAKKNELKIRKFTKE